MRLIDAHALFPNNAFYVNESDPMTSLDELLKRIVEAPTLDYAPVIHGKWNKHTYWIGSWGENQMICSKCSKKYAFHAEYNYCPNCGAKMDGGKKDD